MYVKTFFFSLLLGLSVNLKPLVLNYHGAMALNEEVTCLAHAPDYGNVILVGTKNNKILVVNVQDRKVQGELRCEGVPCSCAVVDGWLAVVCDDGSCTLHNLTEADIISLSDKGFVRVAPFVDDYEERKYCFLAESVCAEEKGCRLLSCIRPDSSRSYISFDEQALSWYSSSYSLVMQALNGVEQSISLKTNDRYVRGIVPSAQLADYACDVDQGVVIFAFDDGRITLNSVEQLEAGQLQLAFFDIPQRSNPACKVYMLRDYDQCIVVRKNGSCELWSYYVDRSNNASDGFRGFVRKSTSGVLNVCTNVKDVVLVPHQDFRQAPNYIIFLTDDNRLQVFWY